MVDEGFNEFVLNLGRDVFEPQRASGHCRPRSLPETQTRRMECIGSGASIADSCQQFCVTSGMGTV